MKKLLLALGLTLGLAPACSEQVQDPNQPAIDTLLTVDGWSCGQSDDSDDHWQCTPADGLVGSTARGKSSCTWTSVAGLTECLSKCANSNADVWFPSPGVEGVVSCSWI